MRRKRKNNQVKGASISKLLDFGIALFVALIILSWGYHYTVGVIVSAAILVWLVILYIRQFVSVYHKNQKIAKETDK